MAIPCAASSCCGGSSRPPKRGPKQRLDIDQIVEAAIALADAEGLAALSMRKVAERLGVGTMSLYTYVPGQARAARPDDRRRVEPSAAASAAHPWRARLERIARENWDRYHRHPWLLEVTPLRPVLGPNTIARYDHELAAIDGIGLTDIEMDSVLSCSTRTSEYTARRALEAAQAEQRTGLTDEQWWAARAPVLERVIEPDHYPIATRVGTAAGEAHNAAYAPEHAFVFGLRESSTASNSSYKGGLPTAEFECSRNFYRTHWTYFRSLEISRSSRRVEFNGGEPLMRRMRYALLAVVAAIAWAMSASPARAAETVVIDAVDSPASVLESGQRTIEVGDTVRWEFDSALVAHTPQVSGHQLGAADQRSSGARTRPRSPGRSRQPAPTTSSVTSTPG